MNVIEDNPDAFHGVENATGDPDADVFVPLPHKADRPICGVDDAPPCVTRDWCMTVGRQRDGEEIAEDVAREAVAIEKIGAACASLIGLADECAQERATITRQCRAPDSS